MISSGRATLHELSSVYSVEEAYDLLEIVMVDAYNQAVASKKAAEKAKKQG